jgi:hypothetical protein
MRTKKYRTRLPLLCLPSFSYRGNLKAEVENEIEFHFQLQERDGKARPLFSSSAGQRAAFGKLYEKMRPC